MNYNMSSFSNISSGVSVNVKHYQVAGSGLARIVAAVTHSGNSRENPEAVRNAITSKFNGELIAVANSFVSVEKSPYEETFTGLVAVKRDSIAVSPEDKMEGFRSHSSNMYLDNEDRLWKLEKTKLGNLLVRSTGIDDEESLIKTLSAYASSAPKSSREAAHFESVSSSLAQAAEGGDYVTYVGYDNNLHQGYLAVSASDSDQCFILERGQESAEEINKSAIVAIHPEVDPGYVLPESDQMNVALAASRDAVTLEMILDYYRRVYAYAPDYFAELEKRFREVANL